MELNKENIPTYSNIDNSIQKSVSIGAIPVELLKDEDTTITSKYSTVNIPKMMVDSYTYKRPPVENYNSSIRFYPSNQSIELCVNNCKETEKIKIVNHNCNLSINDVTVEHKIIINKEKISENNSEDKSENNYENKYEIITGNNSEINSENSKKHFENKTGNFFENKNENKSEQHFENKYENKTENKDKGENENKFNYDGIDVSNVIKRVLENNRKEAAVRQRNFFSNYPQSYMNLNMNKSGNRFFIGNPNGQGRSDNIRPNTDKAESTMNFLEVNISDITNWKKHEEIWNNVKVTHKNIEIKSSNFNFTFEPHSLTTIEIRKHE